MMEPEDVARIEAALGGVSREERLVCLLLYAEELTTTEAGVVLGISPVEVERLNEQLVARVANMLKRSGGNDEKRIHDGRRREALGDDAANRR